MNSTESECIVQALGHMRKVCRVIRGCFTGSIAIFSVGLAVVFASSGVGQLQSGRDGGGAVACILIYGALAVLILWNLRQLFGEVVEGNPPFSEVQADRLRSISVISLGIVILDALLSFGFMFEAVPELGFGMVVNDGITEPTLNLNFGMLAFSAIMYSLSAIFRYAALLQQLSDETV